MGIPDRLPGERELARTPPRWLVWTLGLVLTALPVGGMALVHFFSDLGQRPEGHMFFYVFGSITILQIALLIPLLRWGIMVTDRRVLIRRGFLKREIEEIDRSEIESIRQKGATIQIQTPGGIVEAVSHSLTAARILDVIDGNRANSRRPRGMMGVPLQPGEEVRLRPRSTFLNSSFATLLAGFAALAVTLLRSPGDHEIEPGYFMVLVAIPVVVVAAAGAFALVLSRSEKQWRITGRRVLAIQGVFRRRLEEIALDRIRASTFDGATLTLMGDDRTVDLPLIETPANDLQRVLGHWFPWPGKPMAPVDALLHPGERLLLRRPRRWAAHVGYAAIAVAFIGIAGFAVLDLYHGKDIGEVAPMLANVVLLAIAIPAAVRESRWSLAVTDRRILLRRRHDPSRFDELPLDAIEETAIPSRHSPKLTLRGQGREFIIHAGSNKAAKKLRETIEAAKTENRWVP